MTERFLEALATAAFAVLPEALVRRNAETRHRILEEEQAADAVATTLDDTQGRISGWPVEHDGVSAFDGGLFKV